MEPMTFGDSNEFNSFIVGGAFQNQVPTLVDPGSYCFSASLDNWEGDVQLEAIGQTSNRILELGWNTGKVPSFSQMLDSWEEPHPEPDIAGRNCETFGSFGIAKLCDCLWLMVCITVDFG